MGPHADFVCLSKKCQQDGAASVYDLPIAAKRCPVCGSKRLQRLYNAVNISKSGFRSINAIVDKAGADALEMQHEQRDARLGAQKRESPMFAVPIRDVAGPLGLSTAGGSRPVLGRPAHPVEQQIRGRLPRPSDDSLIDREHPVPA